MAMSLLGAASNNAQFAGHHERGEITTQTQKAKKRMKRKSYLTEEKLTGANRRFLSRANNASLMRQAI
jgi:hypothetical protein